MPYVSHRHLGSSHSFVFFCSLTSARMKWFENLSLPGEWVEQLGDDKIGGVFDLVEDKDGEQEQVGDWEIVRSDLILTPVGGPAVNVPEI